MDSTLYSQLNGKDPKALKDIIELNDGTRIPSIILKVSNDEIQYFNGRNSLKERVPAQAIHMLYIDDATISIPFPLTPPGPQNKLDQF